jgi:hypothetical protein
VSRSDDFEKALENLNDKSLKAFTNGPSWFLRPIGEAFDDLCWSLTLPVKL